jgi:TPR repeat protein
MRRVVGLIALLSVSLLLCTRAVADARSGRSEPAAVAEARLAISQISDRDWSIADSDVVLQRVADRSSRKGLEALAASGDPKARTLVGLALLTGAAGFPHDEAGAAMQFELASKDDFAAALVMLGFMYQYGYGGLPQDERKAAELYRKAAAKGDAGGQMCLGDLYLDGKGGLPKDRAKAIQLYRASAGQGDKLAEDKLSAIGERP